MSAHLDVAALAREKRLDPSFLRGLGVEDAPNRGGVLIRYFAEDSREHPRVRLRTALRAKDGSRWLGPTNVGPIAYGLWRLAEAREKQFVLLVEGESDCWALWQADFPALGIPGATLAKVLRAEHFEGLRAIYVYREPDKGGDAFVQGVARRLWEWGFTSEAFEFSLPPFKDPADAYRDNPVAFVRRVQDALDRAQLLNAPPASHTNVSAAPKQKDPPQKETLIAIGRRAELFHDGDTCYATVEVDGHQETYAIARSGFKNWLLQQYFEERGDAPDDQALREARAMLSALARFKGAERKVYVRLAHYAGRVFLDLGNANWQIVEIGAGGWRTIEAGDAPVRFRRAPGMLPLPVPAPGGRIDDLRPFLNCASGEAFVLDVAWLVGCFSHGPYPVLIQQAEEGSAKSTCSRVLRSLIDPNEIPLRSPPKEEGDVLIAAQNGWLVAYDNLSALASWLSDALCRLSTGAGLSKRQLYTDADEVLLAAKRPAILTSIEELPERGDLLSRAIIQARPFIPENQRRPEDEFWAAFQAAQPKLLGALFTAVAGALANLNSVRLPGLPRMADFAKWVAAAEPALGWEPGTFLSVYAGNRQSAIDVALEASPVGTLIRDKLDLPFEGTATALLTALNQLADEATQRARDWPKTGRGMRSRLSRIASPLRHIGIEVQFGGRNRWLTITKAPPNVGKQPYQPSQPSGNPKNLGKSSRFSSLASDGCDGSHGCATVGDDRTSAKNPNDFKDLGPASDGCDGSHGQIPAFGGNDADADIEPCPHGEDPVECDRCREETDAGWEELG
jgi:hypothetical protein